MYEKPLRLDSSEQKIWFVSDTHFSHKAIINFCKRPFNSIEEMNEVLISNWNSVINPQDLVFHLGDFAFASNGEWKRILGQLNGKIHLIVGNHDDSRYPGRQTFDLFESVSLQKHLIIDKRHVILNHYPFLCYAGTYRKPDNCAIQLHGHVHSGPNNTGLDADRLKMCFPYQYDVGVDNNNYTPISWEEVLMKIKENGKHL